MFDYRKVINGNYGQVWIDSDLLGEAFSLQAKVTNVKADVKVLGDMWKHSKIVGYEGKGTIKLNKISSRIMLKLQSQYANGIQTPCVIYSTLADPASYGTERMALLDVTFDELTIVDFEVGKNIEESIPFTFAGFTPVDTIAPPTA